jgi:uncharacterized HhH-GPD family protein
MSAELHLTGDENADQLLSSDPNALLIGMVLDQQDRLEKAFAGPWVLAKRMGGTFDPSTIAEMDVDEFVGLCAERPAVHRFPGSMGKRVHQVCQALVRDYGGNAANLWAGVTDGKELKRRVGSLPGFGDQKASIFVALLGKRLGVTPDGWRDAAGKYGEEGSFRSVADIVDADSLVKVRETKKAEKAGARAAAEAK